MAVCLRLDLPGVLMPALNVTASKCAAMPALAAVEATPQQRQVRWIEIRWSKSFCSHKRCTECTLLTLFWQVRCPADAD